MMKVRLPKISLQLDILRQKARSLALKGFREESIELMKIARGEVKIEADTKLFGLNATDMKKARTCTRIQRMMLAANRVLLERTPMNSEDEYADAIDRVSQGNLRWPKRKPKKVLISEQAELHGISKSSLEKFMKDKEWEFVDPLYSPTFEYPDWHPDSLTSLFEKGEINS